jgi:hypothetical protein
MQCSAYLPRLVDRMYLDTSYISYTSNPTQLTLHTSGDNNARVWKLILLISVPTKFPPEEHATPILRSTSSIAGSGSQHPDRGFDPTNPDGPHWL